MLERKEFAHKIALDLYNYMLSFSSENPSQTSMVVPKNVFDSWLSRFEAKYKRDQFYDENGINTAAPTRINNKLRSILFSHSWSL